MKLEDLQQAIKDGQAQVTPPPDTTEEVPVTTNDLAKFIAVLEALRRPKYHLDTVPDFTPKTVLDQIQFYDDGVAFRIYFYINGTWRYAALT